MFDGDWLQTIRIAARYRDLGGEGFTPDERAAGKDPEQYPRWA